MKKITFYGKDFSDISKTEFYDHGSGNHGIIGDSWYYDLLAYFLDTYRNIKLRFPKKPLLFYKFIGVFRIKELKFGNETYDVTLEISCRFDTEKRRFSLRQCCFVWTPRSLIL